jgi:5-methylcytosine-specific restriction enzyme A
MATDNTSSRKPRKKTTKSEKREKLRDSQVESRKKHQMATGTLDKARRRIVPIRGGETLSPVTAGSLSNSQQDQLTPTEDTWLRRASNKELRALIRHYTDTGAKQKKVRPLRRELLRRKPTRTNVAKQLETDASVSSIAGSDGKKSGSPKSWSKTEIELIVGDYFEMLEDEVNGRSINKAAHNRTLLPKLDGRSRGSIEFKHCNISAVLSDSGRKYIAGYKPRPNVQGLLVEIVNEKWQESSFSTKDVSEPHVPASDSTEEDILETEGSEPERVTRSIMQRRGQKSFRDKLLIAYGGRCAVTGDGPLDVLEAAHIEPYATSGLNHHTNGLLLRADIHTLFDLDLIRINPDTLRVETTTGLNETSYSSLAGTELRTRLDGQTPSDKLLRKRYQASAPN